LVKLGNRIRKSIYLYKINEYNTLKKNKLDMGLERKRTSSLHELTQHNWLNAGLALWMAG